jgi:hypothetical protein
LCFWQHLCLYLIDAKPGGDGIGGDAVVPGHHNDAQTSCLEFGQGSHGCWLYRVGDGSDGSKFSVDGDVDYSCSVLAKTVGVFGQFASVNRQAVEIIRAACCHPLALNHADGAFARRSVKAHDAAKCHALGFCGIDDRHSQRVFAALFEPRREAKDFISV